MQKIELDEPRWLIVHTKPQQEWLANVQLNQQGFETFYPHEMRTIRHAGRVDGVVRPYLPRYLFLSPRPGQSLRPVNSTIGVSTVLYLAGMPLRVPEDVIAELQARCDQGGRLLSVAPKPESKRHVGEIVKLGSGPLEGFIAEISRVDSSEHIRVWVSLFGRKVETSISESGIAA